MMSVMNRALCVLLFSMLAFIFPPLTAHAVSLDANYGQNGFTLTPLSGGGGLHPFAQQLDGKSLVSGAVATGAYRSTAIARYTSTGALDPGFATSGVFVRDFGVESIADAGVGLQSDGKVVFAGHLQTGGSRQLFAGRL